MRVIPLIAAALSLFISGPALSQGWIEYSSEADLFRVLLPGEPEVEDIAYDTQYFITLPGRMYTYQDGPNRYSVTAVDWRDAEERHADLVVSCRAAGNDGDICFERSELDTRGAMTHAAWNIMRRGAKVTDFVYNISDFVEGFHMQVTNEDGSRNYAAINMHENRLYILEARVTADAIPPLVFQQSLGFVDPEEEGNTIRYRSIYTNGFTAPARSR